MTQEQLWVVAYDSPNNKRRRKLAKLLEGYGERLQWSVFECRLHPHQLRRLRQGLARIATAEDSIRLWGLPQRAHAAEQLGRSVEPMPWQDKVIRATQLQSLTMLAKSGHQQRLGFTLGSAVARVRPKRKQHRIACCEPAATRRAGRGSPATSGQTCQSRHPSSFAKAEDAGEAWQLPPASGGARLWLDSGSKAPTGLMPFLLAAHPPTDRRNPSIFVVLRAALQRNGSQRFRQP